jgi:hypothetical protein
MPEAETEIPAFAGMTPLPFERLHKSRRHTAKSAKMAAGLVWCLETSGADHKTAPASLQSPFAAEARDKGA